MCSCHMEPFLHKNCHEKCLLNGVELRHDELVIPEELAEVRSRPVVSNTTFFSMEKKMFYIYTVLHGSQ